MFDTETKKYNQNRECEKHIMHIYYTRQTVHEVNTTDANLTPRKPFTDMMTQLSIEHFGWNK